MWEFCSVLFSGQDNDNVVIFCEVLKDKKNGLSFFPSNLYNKQKLTLKQLLYQIFYQKLITLPGFSPQCPALKKGHYYTSSIHLLLKES